MSNDQNGEQSSQVVNLYLDDDKHYNEDDEVEKENVKKLVKSAVAVGDRVSSALNQATCEGFDSQEAYSQPPAKRFKNADGTATTQTSIGSVGKPPSITRESSVEGGIAVPPSFEMTGVVPSITRMCAALSGQIYTAKSASELKLSKDKLDAEVILFDDNGKLAEITPPMAIAVTGTVMVIGWRGSSTLMDWVMDFAFAPLASRAWTRTAPYVRAQGGYSALVENFLSKHKTTVLKEIKDRKIRELIFTGHSLAGGVAQVAQLFVEGERLAPTSEWPSHTDLTVRCISFSAPMTTVNLNRKHRESAEFIYKVGQKRSNIIFESDPVPRAYADLSFVNSLIEDAIPQIAQGIPIPRVAKWAFGLQSRIKEAVANTITSQEDLIAVMSKFRHVGKIIYYENANDPPEVYIDKGFSYKKPEESTEKLFRDIQYKKSDDVFGSATNSHLFLVTGPGLAYGIKRS